MTPSSEDEPEDAPEQRIQDLQAELVPAQWQTELGQVVATLVHDANQALAAIGNYANACHRLVIAGRQDDVPIMLERIGAQTKRAGKILQQIREVARKVDPTIEP